MIYSFYILSQTLYSRGCCPLYEAVAGKALFESSSRNSRLAACIILPEICSRGFSLRPLFDASLERIEATRQKLPWPSLSRLGKTASNLQDYACGQGSHGSAYTYTCMHESLASLTLTTTEPQRVVFGLQ